MTVLDFEKKNALSRSGQLMLAFERDVVYIRAKDPRHPTYGCPPNLRGTFSDNYMWEIGPAGKNLVVGDLLIRH